MRKKKPEKPNAELFFEFLKLLKSRNAALVYYRCSGNVSGAIPPPGLISLTVQADTGERIALLSINESDSHPLSPSQFKEVRDLILHDGKSKFKNISETEAAIIGSAMEVHLDSGVEGFSDAIRLIGAETACGEIVERAGMRHQFSEFFEVQTKTNPDDPSWASGSARLRSGRYEKVALEILRLLK